MRAEQAFSESPDHRRQRLQVERQTPLSSQAATGQHMSGGVEVQQDSSHSPWYSQAQALLGGRRSDFLQPTRGGGPTHTGVQVESFSEHLTLWFWAFRAPPKGVPITSVLTRHLT